MAYCNILIPNLWESGTVTGLTEAAGLPATNSQNPERTKVWRSNSSTTGQYLLCDLGTSQACDYAAIANLVRQNGEAVKLYEGGTGSSPGAYNLVATFPTESSDTRLTAVKFSTTSARHWKILWTNTGAAAVAEAGYVGLGAVIAQTRLCTPTVDLAQIDPSVEQASVDGQKSYTSRTGYYAGTLNFDFMLEADRTLFSGAWRTVKRQLPFFLAIDTGIINMTWLMRYSGNLGWSTWNFGGTPRYRLSFEWEEAR